MSLLYFINYFSEFKFPLQLLSNKNFMFFLWYWLLKIIILDKLLPIKILMNKIFISNLNFFMYILIFFMDFGHHVLVYTVLNWSTWFLWRSKKGLWSKHKDWLLYILMFCKYFYIYCKNKEIRKILITFLVFPLFCYNFYAINSKAYWKLMKAYRGVRLFTIQV